MPFCTFDQTEMAITVMIQCTHLLWLRNPFSWFPVNKLAFLLCRYWNQVDAFSNSCKTAIQQWRVGLQSTIQHLVELEDHVSLYPMGGGTVRQMTFISFSLNNSKSTTGRKLTPLHSLNNFMIFCMNKKPVWQWLPTFCYVWKEKSCLNVPRSPLH